MVRRIAQYYFPLAIAALPSTTVAQVPTPASPARLASVITITGFASGFNTYARGNVDEFMHYETGDDSRDADAGSTAFYGFEAVLHRAKDANGDRWVGYGVQARSSADHAIWGSQIAFGGGTDIYFNLQQLNFIMVRRYRTAPAYFAVIEPGIGFANMTGRYNGSGNEDYNATTVGGHLAAGVDYQGSTFVATARLGFRVLVVDASFKDPSSNTGYSQTLCCGPGSDPLQVNWSGLYFTAGVGLAIKAGGRSP